MKKLIINSDMDLLCLRVDPIRNILIKKKKINKKSKKKNLYLIFNFN